MSCVGRAKLLKLALPGGGAKLLKCGCPLKSRTPGCQHASYLIVGVRHALSLNSLNRKAKGKCTQVLRRACPVEFWTAYATFGFTSVVYAQEFGIP